MTTVLDSTEGILIVQLVKRPRESVHSQLVAIVTEEDLFKMDGMGLSIG